MDREQPPVEPSFWFGTFLIALAVAFLAFASQIQRLALSSEHDPGPRAFPITLSLILLLGGGTQALSAWWHRAKRPLCPRIGFDRGRVDVLLLVIGFAVYLVAVPFLGFYVPTAILAGLMTWRLGASWWSACLTVVVLFIVVRLLFVQFFRVQLPEGVFRG